MNNKTESELPLRKSVKHIILESIIKNLLRCNQLAAESKDYKGVIETSKYLLKLSHYTENVYIDVVPEYSQDET